jgi:hypothetical protein
MSGQDKSVADPNIPGYTHKRKHAPLAERAIIILVLASCPRVSKCDVRFICRLTYIFTYLLNYLLTSWSKILLEKLTGFQLVKKFPPF